MADLGAIGKNVGSSGIARRAKAASGTISAAPSDAVLRLKILLCLRSTGAIVTTTHSGKNGVFAVNSTLPLESQPHYVLVFDDDAGTQYNDLILSRITLVDAP